MTQEKTPLEIAEERIADARRSGATELSLWGHDLTTLPESFDKVTQLRRLSISDTQLSKLPERLGQLTQLRELYMRNNQLTTLPEWLGQLTQLQWLSLQNNQLSTLPESLRRLKNLERLLLHDNVGLGLPALVLGPRWNPDNYAHHPPLAKPAEILEYYFRVLMPGTQRETYPGG